MSGDTYKRLFDPGGEAQCGCQWVRVPGIGDVLQECRFHSAATAARVARYEREVACAAPRDRIP